MMQIDQYFLGYRQGEQERLQRQAEMLAGDAQGLFDQIGVFPGAQVVEIGCGPRGCLDLLADRTGPRGSVTGVERNEDAVRLARQFVAERKLVNVDVVHADGRSTGLPKSSYDFATARFVLVNVPHPQQIIAEMVTLVRPGGTVALYEADLLGVFCDPPLPAWNQLIEVLQAYAEMNEIDLFVGRKTPRMLREAGLIDVQTEPIARISPQGHGHRALLLYFAENLRDRLLARNIVARKELDDLVGDVKRHIDDPHTLVLGGLFFHTWGRRPAQKVN